MKFESINEVCIKWQKDLDNAIIGEIKEKAIENGIKTEYILNEKAIINALEKQIPKKPYLKDLWELGTMQGTVCPNCETILITASEKYCKHCGQALDWSDTE